MGLLDRFRRGGGRTGGADRAAISTDEKHLRDWIAARRGVEGFLEPQTATQPVTLLLVAHDGEWTRRRVPSVRWAHEFCNRLGVPSYDAAVVGVPGRMREYNQRNRQHKSGGTNFY